MGLKKVICVLSLFALEELLFNYAIILSNSYVTKQIEKVIETWSTVLIISLLSFYCKDFKDPFEYLIRLIFIG